jgi:hypothetical protein
MTHAKPILDHPSWFCDTKLLISVLRADFLIHLLQSKAIISLELGGKFWRAKAQYYMLLLA